MEQKQKDKALKLLNEYKGNYEKVAKDLHVKAYLVRELDIAHHKRYNYTPEGRGPVKLQPFIVAISKAGTAWDNDEPNIAKARDDYDAGLTEMTTGRDGLNLILYSIPRKKPINNRRPYFVEEEQE